MKILLVSDFFPRGKDLRFSGGVETRTFFLAKNLAKKHNITVICSRQPGTKPVENMFGFKVLRVGQAFPYNSGAPKTIDSPKRLSFISSAISIGKKLDIDIVDGGNFIDHFIVKKIGDYKNIPVVYWYPDVFIGKWIETSGVIGGLVGYFLEKYNLAQKVDKYIAISESTRNKLIESGIKSEKVFKISCGIDINEFKETAKKTKKFQIICISRLVEYKRVKDLILAFALVENKIRNINLLIIGSGPKKKGLINLVKEINLTSKVRFIENLPREELIKNIQESRLFVLPSSVEGFGISTMEAAAAGIPYVVSNIPVLREVTLNGKGGLLFEVGNIKNLASKIQLLLANKKLYSQKSKEAKILAQRYNWTKIAKETENVYKNMIKK